MRHTVLWCVSTSSFQAQLSAAGQGFRCLRTSRTSRELTHLRDAGQPDEVGAAAVPPEPPCTYDYLISYRLVASKFLLVTRNIQSTNLARWMSIVAEYITGLARNCAELEDGMYCAETIFHKGLQRTSFTSFPLLILTELTSSP